MVEERDTYKLSLESSLCNQKILPMPKSEQSHMNISRSDNRNTFLSSPKLAGSSSLEVIVLSTVLLSFDQCGPKSWWAISPTLMSRNRRLTRSTGSFLGILEILTQKSKKSLHLGVGSDSNSVFPRKGLGS